MGEIQIRDRKIGMGYPPYILAEIGLNHNGSETLALEMIEAAFECGVDGVKFQSFDAHEFVCSSQKEAMAIFEKCSLSVSSYEKIVSLCRKRGLHFLSTPFTLSWVSILDDLGVDAFKVASPDLVFYDLIESITQTGKPMILSTGMATASEIDHLTVQDWFPRSQSVFLHCISNYPPRLEDVHLRFIPELGKLTRTPVGISDHTMGTAIAIASVALGACFIEKHFTIRHDLEGPDQKLSLNPVEMKLLVQQARDVHRALGFANKPLIDAEQPVMKIARRGLYPRTERLLAGEVLSHSNSVWKRPQNGVNPSLVRLSHQNASVKDECKVIEADNIVISSS